MQIRSEIFKKNSIIEYDTIQSDFISGAEHELKEISPKHELCALSETLNLERATFLP